MIRRSRPLALALGALLAACSGAPAPVTTQPAAPSACSADHLDACERRLLAAEAGGAAPSHDLAAAYASARAGRDPQDPWARLFHELDRSPHVPAAILADGPLPASAQKLGDSARTVAIGALPKPAAIGEDELLVALAHAADVKHVIVIRPAPGAVTQLFPGDPLAIFTPGLTPVIRDDTARDHLADDIAIAAAIRAAFDAASALRYVDAAGEADKLSALIDKRDRFSEPVLRARFAIQALGNAGITLEAEDDGADKPPAPPTPEAPKPAATDTPYGDFIRVRTAKDERKEWEIRGAHVLTAVSPDRRDDIASLYTRSRDCAATGRVPPMEGMRDLVFASKLSGALIRDKATEDQAARGGYLPLPEWLKRYEAMLDLVTSAHAEWAFAPTLLYQRGEAFGLSPAGTSTYRRVTEIALAHLKATRELEQKSVARYRALSQLSFVYSPGLLGDPQLREALIKLTEVTVQDKLAIAKDASGVFMGVLTGAFAGLSFPPAIQQAHYLALQGAFSAKLHGDLLDKTGWGVAGLYVIDAIYRVFTGEGPNLGFSSAQIARALKDPKLAYPALGALTTAAVRYAALAAEHKLDPELDKTDRFPPDRKAARDALKGAIAGLGAEGEAPGNVLEDVTTLADGLIATLTTALGAPKPPGAVCPSKSPVTLSPATRRALARLGDVRRRILGHPRYKDGDGAWVRRTRLVMTLLSDAMDIALKEEKRLSFTIPAPLAEKNVTEALRDWDDRPLADAVGSVYALVREFVSADSPDKFLKGSGQHIRRVVGGLIAFFRSDPGGSKGPANKGTALGVALLDAVARMGLDKKQGDDLAATLINYADAFYESKQQDQGDLWLLGSMVLTAITQSPPSPATIALAQKHKSRVEWALNFLGEMGRAKRGEVPDPKVFATGMRQAIDDACQAPNADQTIAVVQAIHDFTSNRRSEGRAALDKVLEQADKDGLTVPRMGYRYEEKTATKIFALTLEVSYGSGFLEGANSFQVGLGVKSKGEPEGSMTAKLLPADSPKAGEDAVRYYVHVAALATVYHLLESDGDRAAAAARRAIAALSMGVKLGARTVRKDKPASFGADARPVLAVAAQLAAEAGMPFLAGDLWTVVRDGLSPDADDKTIAGVLDPEGNGKTAGPLPLGLAGIKELSPIAQRAAKSLKVVAEPLACTHDKIELGAYEEPSCDTYALSLSLRIADVLKKLPRLKHGEGGGRCAPLRSLDGFLSSAEKGAYDPDAFTRAVEDLRASGRTYDAAILLTRQRRDNHCSPAIVSIARSLGRSPLLGPWIRSDLLSTAVNCSIAGGGPDLDADLLALDADTRTLPDPTRNLKVMMSLADLATRTDQWGPITKLAAQPDFVDRWMSIHPNAAAAALLIAHAVPVVSGSAPNLEKTRASVELLCDTFPPGDRADLCSSIKALRAPLRGPMAERQRLAKEAVKALVNGGPPAKKP